MTGTDRINTAPKPEFGRHAMAARQIGMMIMVLMLALGGLSACGKRGDPYRPSEVPADSSATS